MNSPNSFGLFVRLGQKTKGAFYFHIGVNNMNEYDSIKIPFNDFMQGNYEEGERNLYIVWMGEKCLYVGIARTSIHDRWFNSRSHHYGPYGSLVGRAIYLNKPDSLSWEIEMLHVHNDLEFYEESLIYNLKPLFNSTHNNAERTQQEREEETKLYNTLLWGNENHYSNAGVILPR